MITRRNCGVCGQEVVVPEDPLNQRDEGIAVTMETDVTGEPVAQWHHSACRASELKRRGRGAAAAPAAVDWEAQIAAVLAEAKDS